MRRGLATLVGALLLAAVVAAGSWPLDRPEAAPSSPWGREYLPNVDVVDHGGRQVKFYDDLVRGRIVVISFIYTSCTSICPLTLARLAEVHDRLGPAMGRDIHFLSISIDPIPDTPEKLAMQAKAFGAGPGWTFVTGDTASIDLIRYKLGERSGTAIASHRNEVLMYNDRTSEWSRDSAFADLGVLEANIRAMDPEYRLKRPDAEPPAPPTPHGGVVRDGPGQTLFIKACASCHTVGGGDKVGPDLAGLAERRDAAWISAYMRTPDRLRKSGDPIALELGRRYPAVRMPTLGLSEDDVLDLMAYLETRK